MKRLHWLAAAMSVLSLGVLASAAPARNLSISNVTWKVTYNPMNFEAEGVGLRIQCPVTLSGSYHARTFGKVAGALIGYLNAATVNEAACTGEGTVEFDRTSLPVAIRYSAFTGTLPNITEISTRMIPPRITNNWVFLFWRCTYATGVGESVTRTLARGSDGRLGLIAEIWRVPGVATNSGVCPAFLHIDGTGTMRTAEGATVTMTLI